MSSSFRGLWAAEQVVYIMARTYMANWRRCIPERYLIFFKVVRESSSKIFNTCRLFLSEKEENFKFTATSDGNLAIRKSCLKIFIFSPKMRTRDTVLRKRRKSEPCWQASQKTEARILMTST